MNRTLMIEGFPYCFGDGPAPDWYEGEKLPILAPIGTRGTITQSIDPLGGVAQIGDLTFTLTDKTGPQFTPQNPIGRIFRFFGENYVNIKGPARRSNAYTRH